MNHERSWNHPQSGCRMLAVVVLGFWLGGDLQAAEPAPPSGNAVIRAPAHGSEIVITTTARLAGAIHSVTWNGTEFIDSFDHGRQLQSASNLDLQSPFSAETFNPTEAGSMDDGAGPTSTSRLLHLVTTPNSLQSTTQMAFWLAPGEQSGGQPAKNGTRLSDHLLTKRVTIGYRQLPQVIQYDVTFSLPLTEKHRVAQFEAVTGYMPAEFSKFWSFNPQTQRLEDLSDGPGEQNAPVVLATASGHRAMGVYSPDQPSPGYAGVGYGRFRFTDAKVTKWNCVFRIRDDAQGVAAGDYAFRTFVIVGDLPIVTAALIELHREHAKPAKN
ncbi:MAG: hypothetical protein V4719_16120 [Planctomycetota bacterium]